MADVNGKVWTKEDIKNLLFKNDKAVFRGVVRIYERQTADEKAVGETAYNNGVGFSGADANILSSFARQIQEYDPLTSKFKTPLSPKQLEIARKKIVKYAGQLADIANNPDRME